MPVSAATGDLPLDGLRVVDTAEECGELCGRLLADLGATVLRVEPPGGASSRALPPLAPDGTSLWFAYRNVNKRGMVIDLGDDEGRKRLDDLLAGADVWVESSLPGELSAVDPSLDPSVVVTRHPHLVITSVTDFGRTGPYAGYVGTDMISVAMGGLLFRSGSPERPPLVSPGNLGHDAAGAAAALGTLLALRQRYADGLGQHLDVSATEAVANLTDWGLPTWSDSGATAARAGAGAIYPIYPCADGHVRMVSPLNPREWRSLVEWLGRPEEIAGPEWDQIMHRFGHAETINDLIVRFFSTRSKGELSDDAMERGLAVTPVLRPGEVLRNEHAASRETFGEVEVASGVKGRLMAGWFSVDGDRAGYRYRAPDVGEHDDEGWPDGTRMAFGDAEGDPGSSPSRPLEGIRVLDFGIGAVGVEGSRILAEYGADVIKIESSVHPDFIRVVFGSDMNPLFASSSRTKRSLGVNLDTDEGRALVLRLAAHADVVVENSATGVMDRLGMDHASLSALNPGIVMVSSQLMGSHGVWRGWKGYGPNTRAPGGITWLWSHPEDEDEPPGSSAVHPDHFVGRLLALLAVAMLLRRERTGRGGHADAAQIDTAMALIGDLLLQESITPGSVHPLGNRSERGVPWGVFPCEGDDEWCAICVRSDDEWERLRQALGDPEWAAGPAYATAQGRREDLAAIEGRLEGWTGARGAREVMETLQAAGVPAGMVLHPALQAEDPHFEARDFAQPVEQPGVGPLLLEGPAFRGSRMAGPLVEAAPATGEHTREVCTTLLGMSDDEVDALVEAGVLEEVEP